MSNILITGGAGYLGVTLSKLLCSNHNVTILDPFWFGEVQLPEGVSIINSTYGDYHDLRGIDTIIHLAGLVGDPACKVAGENVLSNNFKLFNKFIEKGIEQGVTRVLFASSCSVYGKNSDICTELTKPNPISLYAEDKILIENYLTSLHQAGLINVKILRLSTLFGWSERMRYDLAINRFTAQAFINGQITLHGGGQFRPFLHVQDAARAFSMLLESSNLDFEVFNIGSSQNTVSLFDVGKIILQHFPEVSINIDNLSQDQRDYRVDFGKIESRVGFSIDYSISDGIQEIVNKLKKMGRIDIDRTNYSNLEQAKTYYYFRDFN